MTIYNNFYENKNTKRTIYVYSVFELKRANPNKCKLLVKFIDLQKTNEIGTIVLDNFTLLSSQEFDKDWHAYRPNNEEEDNFIESALNSLMAACAEERAALKLKLEELDDALDNISKDISISNMAEKYGDLFIIKKKTDSDYEFDEEFIDDIANVMFTFIYENAHAYNHKSSEDIDKLCQTIEINVLQKIESFGNYQLDINKKQIAQILKEIKQNG